MDKNQLNMTRVTIAEECKSRRESLGMSLAELSEKTDLPQYSLQQFENGMAWINTKYYIIILHALGMKRLEPVWEAVPDLESKKAGRE